ncbi:tetratricopeptide repeat protein [Enterococcus italicus]|nr:tetratricopeptide repeat protein [Enterococcus italicus]MCM6932188.1 tetratricopeptide repeat protein [Enterococcus italicus]
MRGVSQVFGFKKKKVEKLPSKKENQLSLEEQSILEDELTEKNNLLLNIQVDNKPQLAYVCEQIGIIQAKLNLTDEAIQSLEKSLEYEASIGEGYKKLMGLYNEKRIAAAYSGDDEKIDYYMGKMDEMRQIAKKLTISRK